MVFGNDLGVEWMSLVELARRMASKELSPVEVVDHYLGRIGRFNPLLNAFVFVAEESARVQARDSERRIVRGDIRPLEGVPIAIKDDTVVAGMPTSHETAMAVDEVRAVDAYVVEQLRRAGAIILGKTNLPEFGTIPVTESQRWGSCLNPWDIARTPGGSSGGSAAAVAAAMVPAAHGRDGGGSLRIPAACCGLFTLKPTRGRISQAPYGSESPLGLTTDGFITRTVRDNAVLLDIVSGHVPGDPYWASPAQRPFEQEIDAPLERLRIAWSITPPIDVPVHRACSQAVMSAVEACRDVGHIVEEISLDWHDSFIPDGFMQVWSATIGGFMDHLTDNGGDSERAETHNRALFERGRRLPVTTYVKTASTLRAIARRIVVPWDRYDVVLTPTLAQPPVPIGALFGHADDPLQSLDRAWLFTPFTAIINMTGQPAVHIPLAWHDHLPSGVQAIGRQGDEATLLRLSVQLERVRPWAHRRPPSFIG